MAKMSKNVSEFFKIRQTAFLLEARIYHLMEDMGERIDKPTSKKINHIHLRQLSKTINQIEELMLTGLESLSIPSDVTEYNLPELIKYYKVRIKNDKNMARS